MTTTPEANQLLLEGTLALAEISHQGVRVDKTYLETALKDTKLKIADCEKQLRSDPFYLRYWQRRYGEKANLAAPEQLSAIVFKDLGYPIKVYTSKFRRAAANAKALEAINIPFVKSYLRAAKLRKLYSTYLGGIWREMVRHHDGFWYVHPNYNLNTVTTYRSSCSDPNWQNIYKRDPEFMEIVRHTYIPMPGDQIGEIDYGQGEVRLACPYTQDPVLMNYVCDPSTDMHRDMATEIFFLLPGQISKAARHIAKNKFVFPEFYGSFYAQCAPDIWEAIDSLQLKVEGEDLTIRQHLTNLGITELGRCDPEEEPVRGTFEYHIRAVERKFWDRFKVYAQWKRDWWTLYQARGWYQMLTGFVCNMRLDRKQVCNGPIQGSLFHCLLWSIIQINKRLKKYKFKSRMIGEIHDACQFNLKPRERDDVLHLSSQIMTTECMKHYPWINVGLTAEPEVCPIDRSWVDLVGLVDDPTTGKLVPADMAKWSKKYGDWNLQLGV